MAPGLQEIPAEVKLFVVSPTTSNQPARTAEPVSVRNMGTSRQSRASRSTEARPASVENPTPADNPSPVTPAVTTSAVPGVQRLMETLSALGMNAAGLQISYSEEVVGYPGGSYVNRLINVTSNGRTEHLSADLTEKNPTVAAYDIQRFLRGTA